ncbi:hypothetical protein, partial [Campylobacter sp. LR196d]|uniref:hypothetical protein n=1 Tax=Campylobacter sp. LR196d TaxID=2593543 RepID=UPI001680024F
NLSKLYRASNPNLSATREIEAYNQDIQERRKAVNKELKTLDSKQDKEKIKKLKDELAKLKEIKILEDSAPFEIPKSWA